MGAEVNGQNGRVDPEQGNPVNGTVSNSSSATSSRDSGRGTGTGRGSGTGSGTETKEEKVSGLVTVEVPAVTDEAEKKRLERNAKRRERYAKQKEATGGSVKPRKVNGKKPEPKTMDNKQMNMMILSISALVSSRPNCEQWLLTEAEVDSITKPLVAMLSESEALNVINENSNQIALVFACITVFAPRIIVTVQKMKAEKEREKVAKQHKVTVTEGENKGTDRPNTVKPTANSEGVSNGLSFFGSPTG